MSQKQLHEIIVNLHMHTPYSDGHGSHEHIAESAIKAGIDVIIVTDHNVWVQGKEGMYGDGDHRVMMLVGEEIHDQARHPQKNHLLVFGANRELAPLAKNPQRLLNGVRDAGGIAFLAHPYDPENKVFNEPDLSWVSWDITGYTGIELWNGLSEFKSLLKSYPHAIYYALNPEAVPHGPPPKTIAKWDELLKIGQKVVAVGGSDAHALPGKLGPITRTIFPYEYHFRAVNTHVLLNEPLTGKLDNDKPRVLAALKAGHCFVANDLPHPTRGFRFRAHGRDELAVMGDEISAKQGVTFQIRLPMRAECRVLCDGDVIKTVDNRESFTLNTTKPGAYRVEVYVPFKGKRRAWIFSNPIYVRG